MMHLCIPSVHKGHSKLAMLINQLIYQPNNVDIWKNLIAALKLNSRVSGLFCHLIIAIFCQIVQVEKCKYLTCQVIFWNYQLYIPTSTRSQLFWDQVKNTRFQSRLILHCYNFYVIQSSSMSLHLALCCIKISSEIVNFSPIPVR